MNLKMLNRNKNYETIYYANDIVLLKRLGLGDYSKQVKWSDNLEKYQKMNHDCMKSELIRKLRLF